METIHSVQRFSPGYHRDNILITKGCIGRRIGIPQRIRVTTWNQAYINYTKCVKSERSYIMQIPAWKQSHELPCRCLFCLSPQYGFFQRSYSQLDDRLLFVCYTGINLEEKGEKSCSQLPWNEFTAVSRSLADGRAISRLVYLWDSDMVRYAWCSETPCAPYV